MRQRIAFLLTLLCLLPGCQNTVRFATFDAPLTRDKPGQLLLDLSVNTDPQFKNIAEIIQRTNPDVLLLSGLDYDPLDRAVYLFEKNYLLVSQNGAPPIKFPSHYTAPVNAGVASGYDMDRDGKVVNVPGSPQYAGDAIGYGLYPGQGGMTLLSKFPILRKDIRTFQRFRWKDMPGNLIPKDATGKPVYDDDTLKVLRLSSRNHCDVPIEIGNHKIIHVLISNPAATVGASANPQRNHDELRLWHDYIGDTAGAKYIHDDTATPGGLPMYMSGAMPPLTAGMAKPYPFVMLGNLNADPQDGPGRSAAMDQLLKNARVNSSFVPSSPGAREAAQTDGGKNLRHQTPSQFDTEQLPATGSGNLRLDYILPSMNATVKNGAVYWPPANDPLSRLVLMQPKPASSAHRLVYLDIHF